MDINEISKNTINRYSKRYESFGEDIKTLGWGSREQQDYRFRQTLSATDFNAKSIVDIGCGFGDYAGFLTKESVVAKKYHGCDINPDLISEAKKREEGERDFFVFDLARDERQMHTGKFDIGVMLGLLNFNLGAPETNLAYSKLMLNNAFELVNEVLVVDFLSVYCTPDYPQESFVFYHDPKMILEFALTLTPNVTLKHDYLPIPQKEFMIFLYK